MIFNESEALEWFQNGWSAAAKAVERIHIPDPYDTGERRRCVEDEQVWPCSTLQALAYNVEFPFLSGADIAKARSLAMHESRSMIAGTE